MAQKNLSYENLCEKYPTELVFSIDKELCDDIPEGISPVDENDFNEMLFKNGIFVPRKNAEYNPKYSHFIPYVLIKNKDNFFSTMRLSGESRLVGKISVGMGGHINPEDYSDTIGKTIEKNIIRELSDEELHIDLSKTTSLSLIGTIKIDDEKDLVSLDHIGLFYILETEDAAVSIKETESLEGRFVTKEELAQMLDKAENWSKLVIEYITK